MTYRCCLLLGIATGLLACPKASSASHIVDGEQSFFTIEAFVDFDALDPSLQLGRVEFMGDPQGARSTTVRHANHDDGTNTIDIELIALSLTSVDPVGINIFEDPTRPSLGQAILTGPGASGPGDGLVVESFFDVFLVIDVGQGPLPQPDPFRLESTMPFEFNVDAGGNFRVPIGVPIWHEEAAILGHHIVDTPEPGSIVIWGLVGVGILGYCWRRKQREDV